MNDQETNQPTVTRRATDTALILIAIAAVAGFLWRRLKKTNSTELTSPNAETNGSESIANR